MATSTIPKPQVNTSYITDGLTFNGCSYVAGGYAKIGNLVVLNIRVKATQSASFGIEGLPTYSSKATKNVVCSLNADFSTNTQLGFTTVTMGGSIARGTGSHSTGDEIVFSAVYICD